MFDLNKFNTFVFDCDGVILDSNKIKTEAFYEAARDYGHVPAQALKEYHVKNGGISRYKKFDYFLTEIVGKEADEKELNKLLDKFAGEVKKGMRSCAVAEGIEDLRNKTLHAKWLIASGGDQAELREIFKDRNLDKYFDGGIFGSPDNKNTILAREMKNRNITQPALFLGDSKYDYLAATSEKLDFLFISSWSEVSSWEKWCDTEQIMSLGKISDLL